MKTFMLTNLENKTIFFWISFYIFNNKKNIYFCEIKKKYIFLNMENILVNKIEFKVEFYL